MQISTKQRLLRLAAGSMFAAGTVFIPAAVASAETEAGRAEAKAPSPWPELPTPPEGVPHPPGGGD
jgi:hypothetical protein